MKTLFKLEPKSVAKCEFKNGVGQSLVTIIKTDDNKVVFVPKVNNFVLSPIEQLNLANFLLENL